MNTPLVTITTPACIRCKETSQITVTAEQAAAIRGRRVPIQSVLPDFTPEQREQLISGTHPECWKKLFG